jgi:hypothetical protein
MFCATERGRKPMISTKLIKLPKGKVEGNKKNCEENIP